MPFLDYAIQFPFEYLVHYTIFLLFSIVIGVLTINALDTETNGRKVKCLGILTLLFCSVIGGICTLCVSQEELEKNNLPENDDNNQSAPVEDYTEKLKDLKSLFDSGFITEEEYNEKREKYIGLL